MKRLGYFLYVLALSLLTGGVIMYTAVIPWALPDLANKVVGSLMPSYFLYNVVLVLAALLLFNLFAGAREGLAFKGSIVLLVLGVGLAVFVYLGLYPKIQSVLQRIPSFEAIPREFPVIREFNSLHGTSLALNALLFLAGALLLYLSPSTLPGKGKK